MSELVHRPQVKSARAKSARAKSARALRCKEAGHEDGRDRSSDVVSEAAAAAAGAGLPESAGEASRGAARGGVFGVGPRGCAGKTKNQPRSHKLHRVPWFGLEQGAPARTWSGGERAPPRADERRYNTGGSGGGEAEGAEGKRPRGHGRAGEKGAWLPRDLLRSPGASELGRTTTTIAGATGVARAVGEARAGSTGRSRSIDGGGSRGSQGAQELREHAAPGPLVAASSNTRQPSPSHAGEGGRPRQSRPWGPATATIGLHAANRGRVRSPERVRWSASGRGRGDGPGKKEARPRSGPAR